MDLFKKKKKRITWGAKSSHFLYPTPDNGSTYFIDCWEY